MTDVKQRAPPSFTDDVGRYEQLFEAVRSGDLLMTRFYLVQAGLHVNVRDPMGNTPAYYAALCGHLDVLAYLQARGGFGGTSDFDKARAYENALTLQARQMLKKDLPPTYRAKQPHVPAVRRVPHKPQPDQPGYVAPPPARWHGGRSATNVKKTNRKGLPKLSFERIDNTEAARTVLAARVDDDDEDEVEDALHEASDQHVPTPVDELAACFPHIDLQVIEMVLDECEGDVDCAADALSAVTVPEGSNDNVVPEPEAVSADFPPLPRAQLTSPTGRVPDEAEIDAFVAASMAGRADAPARPASFVEQASAAWVAVSAAALALLPGARAAAEPAAAPAPAAAPSPAAAAPERAKEDEDEWDVVGADMMDSAAAAPQPAVQAGAAAAAPVGTRTPTTDSFHALSAAEEASSEQFSMLGDEPEDFDVQSVSSFADDAAGRGAPAMPRPSYSAVARAAADAGRTAVPQQGTRATSPSSREGRATGGSVAAADAPAVVDAETMYWQQKDEGSKASRKNPKTSRSRKERQRRGAGASALAY